MNVREIGEQGLLQRLQAFCPADVVGDDGAVLVLSPGCSIVVTCDVLVDRVHFSDCTTSPEDAGWRAAAANLSDLAAMGATPLGITVSLGLPGDLAVEWVERLYDGLYACVQTYATAIVGGDVVRSPVTTIAITAFGEVQPEHVIRRSTAQPGQAIVVTGWHGASRAGLELLLHPDLQQPLRETERSVFIQTHQRPQPRLDVLPFLRHPSASCSPPSSIAGMDSSDGLADAVIQLCRSSGVGAQLERSRLPIPPGLVEWVGQDKAIEWTLYGGEDFELVLCVPAAIAAKLVDQIGGNAAMIGTITADPTVWLVDSSDRSPHQLLTLEQGFQHFSEA